MFNPHFQHFFSSDVRDSELGSVKSWPSGSALLLLASFEPNDRAQIFFESLWHGIGFTSRLIVSLSSFGLAISSQLLSVVSISSSSTPKGMVLHPMSHWQDLRWDSKPARFSSQLWQIISFANGPAAPQQPCEARLGRSKSIWSRIFFILHPYTKFTKFTVLKNSH